jgi:hypothetical protein
LGGGFGPTQFAVGAVLSTWIVIVGVALLTVLLPVSLVTVVSTVPELSVAKNVTTVVPSTVPGIVIVPLEPGSVPEAGFGGFAPVTL